MTASATGIAVGHYLLDQSASRFTVRVFASGMLSALGHSPTMAIRDFNGEASFDPDDSVAGVVAHQDPCRFARSDGRHRE